MALRWAELGVLRWLVTGNLLMFIVSGFVSSCGSSVAGLDYRLLEGEVERHRKLIPSLDHAQPSGCVWAIWLQPWSNVKVCA